MRSQVNRFNAYLECPFYNEFFIIIHWFTFFQIHLHAGSFDKMLTVCRGGVEIG